MVMMTRSSYRKACDSYESSDSSRNNVMPPWCSKGKVGKHKENNKKDRKVTSSAWAMQSAYPIRDNIWEYLQEERNNFFKRKSRSRCKQPTKKRGRAVIPLVFLSAILGLITAFVWMFNQNTDTSLITRVIPTTTFITLFSFDYQTAAVDEECCSKMKHIADALFQAEKALRGTLRVRRTLMLTSHTNRIESIKTTNSRYIEGIAVSKGEDTEEWRSRVTMWGVVPLWRAPPPPSTVLARRRPIPSDCWPFSGSEGELIFDLPSPIRVRCISLEHVQPDTAMSAPRMFNLYGTLANDTLAKAVDAEYKRSGPAKQYFYSILKDVPVHKFIFQVLSNHGNPRYTCIYRVHFYTSDVGPVGKDYL